MKVFHWPIRTRFLEVGWRWCPTSLWYYNRYKSGITFDIGRIQVIIFY